MLSSKFPQLAVNKTVDLDEVQIPAPALVPVMPERKVRTVTPSPEPKAASPLDHELTPAERRVLEERLQQTRDLEKTLQKRADDERR